MERGGGGGGGGRGILPFLKEGKNFVLGQY